MQLKFIFISVLLFAPTVAIFSSVALIPTTVHATSNSTVIVDHSPPGSEWTYNSESGSLCSTTPDGQTVHCEKVGEGRPCDEVRNEADPNLKCHDSDTNILP